jgi:general secretion pathway protein D
MKQAESPPFALLRCRMKLGISLLGLVLCGCATDSALTTSKALYEKGDVEGALVQIEKAQEADPDDIQLRAAQQHLLTIYDNKTIAAADTALAKEDLTTAMRDYQAVLHHDPGSDRARQGAEAVATRQLHQQWLAQARGLASHDPSAALDWLSKILAEEPDWREALDLRAQLLREQGQAALHARVPPGLMRPVRLSFRNQSLTTIIDAISQMTGVNVILDGDVPTGLRGTIVTQHSTAWDALNLLLASSRLSKKLLNDNTLLIFPNRPDKQKQYLDMGVRTYYLSNADPKQVLDTIKQVLKPKEIAIDDRLGAIVVRDVPSVLAACDRLVQSLDLPQSEVMLDVEVLEVTTKLARSLGLNYPPGLSVGFNGDQDQMSNTILASQLRHLTGDDIRVSMGQNGVAGGADFNETDSGVHTLANPHIRVKNHEKATIKIGQKLPLVTSTMTTVGTSSSVSYEDVGLSLTVTPSISLGREVSVKVDLEVSNLDGAPTTMSDGTMVYTLGNRSASTVLSTRDNVTQVLGGLIERGDSESTNGLPYLSKIPLLGYLFGYKSSDNEDSEIVLLITPHIVRRFTPPPASVSRFDTGPEDSSGDPLQLSEQAGTVNASSTPGLPAGGGFPSNVPPPPPVSGVPPMPPIGKPAATSKTGKG